MQHVLLNRTRQTGLAAIEFALVGALIMIPVMLGIFVFWEVLQTQQVVTRATGDGARLVLRTLQGPRERKADGSEIRDDAQALARQSILTMLRSQLPPVDKCEPDPDECDLDARLTVELQDGPHEWVLDVSYKRPLLLGSAGGLNFIEPASLQARSVIHWP